MRVVITGASGNVGSALTRRLQAAEEHDIVALARRTPDGAAMNGLRWVSVSIDLSSGDCEHPLQQVFRDADAVVHLAWAFQPSHQVRYLEAVGVGGTHRVLDACISTGVGQVVHMSSVGAYSPKRDSEAVGEDWPVDGVPSSAYSRHKAAAEGLLDSFEHSSQGTAVARLRPGIIGQRSAGSASLRYVLPVLLPARAIAAVPVLPMPAELTIPMVHADRRRRGGDRSGPAAEGCWSAQPGRGDFGQRAMIAEALGARWVETPAQLIHALMLAAWRARLQPVAPGWLDLGCAAPALGSSRAERELGWSPKVDAMGVLRETIDGMCHASAGSTAVLRHRTVTSELSELFGRGPISHRRRP